MGKADVVDSNSPSANRPEPLTKERSSLLKWLKEKLRERLERLREDDPKIYPHF